MKWMFVAVIILSNFAYAAEQEEYHSTACDDLPSIKQRVECRINLEVLEK